MAVAPVWFTTATAMLSVWSVAGAAVAITVPPTAELPPIIAPVPTQQPGSDVSELAAVLMQLGPVQYAPAPIGSVPAAGSATESEALRRYVRSQLRRRDGQPMRAADDLDAALRLDPSSPELHRARADVAVEAGDVARAISEWEAVLALNPHDVHAALAVGVASFETGHYERAAVLLGPLWQKVKVDAVSNLNESGKFALGSALARALLRMGFDQAALEPARSALVLDPNRLAAERGDGLDAAVRASAALGRDTGEAALRLGQWDAACDLLLRSVELVPELRAQALAALAAVRAQRPQSARAVLGQLLARGVPTTETQTLLAEWILQQLAGDPTVARRMLQLRELAPGDGRVARLLAAADPANAPAALDFAVTRGAVDRATLRAAFESMDTPGAAALALRALRADPSLTRTAARELVRAVESARELREYLAAAPASPEGQALRSAIASYLRDSGTAWALADAARTQWPEEPIAFFALVEAATAASDPCLVQRATVDASDFLLTDPNWHAAVARAASATGLDELAAASVARCRTLDPASTDAERARASAVGGAPSWSPRGRAEQAIARGDLPEAAAALMEARAIDPEDDAALGMLLRVLPRTVGPQATLDWAQGELQRTPNDPMLWEAYALQAVTMGRSAAALSLVDTRLAGDPDDTTVLAAREALLRATGQTEAALLSARARAASLPPGPRRALEVAAIEAHGGDPAAAVEALQTFAEGAFPPPLGMRAAALDILRRLPQSKDRAAVMRRIARDAILADAAAPLEFFAFEALSTASDPALDSVTREGFSGMIAQEAASAPLHRRPEATEAWRAACDFLAVQGHPREAAEFVRARLDDDRDLNDTDLSLLARAAFAADALAGGGSRASHALELLAALKAAGRNPLPLPPSRKGSALTELAAIFTVVGDSAGATEILEAACAVDPDDAVALNNLAYSRARSGIVDERTVEMARKAVALLPEEAAHLDTLGWILYLQGSLADSPAGPGAVTLLSRAVERAGRAAGGDMFLHLGDAQWRSGDRTAAGSSWKLALEQSALLDRERALTLYRDVLRRQTALGAVDPQRFYSEHDASIALRASARLNAVDAGTEPPVAPMTGHAPAPVGAKK